MKYHLFKQSRNYIDRAYQGRSWRQGSEPAETDDLEFARSVKQKILDRLYDAVSVCDACQSEPHCCSHYSTRSMPEKINRRDVISAIAIGETFFEED